MEPQHNNSSGSNPPQTFYPGQEYSNFQLGEAAVPYNEPYSQSLDNNYYQSNPNFEGHYVMTPTGMMNNRVEETSQNFQNNESYGVPFQERESGGYPSQNLPNAQYNYMQPNSQFSQNYYHEEVPNNMISDQTELAEQNF